jgi:hypothetical protein
MTGPYPGGDYANQGTDADVGIDVNANGTNAQLYRPDSMVSAGKQNQHPDGLPRGDFDVKVNNVVGWNDGGEWYNFTRQFPTPAQDYFVVARLSSGGAAIQTQLDEVTAGAKTTDQTLKKLGEWKPGRATAAWDTMEFFQMTDEAGAAAKVNLGGERTLRLTVLDGSNQDQDYLMFIPATTVAPPPAGGFTSVSRSGNNLVVAWTAGTLEQADNVGGPWTAVPNATSPATVPVTGTQKFLRLK